MRQKVLIDTDPGVDDVQALIMILEAHHKEEIEVIGLATVAGNSYLHHVNRNILRTLEATNSLMEIPVFAGAANQLVQNFVRKADPYFGKDGFGDVEYDSPCPSSVSYNGRFAPLELVHIVNEYPGEVILLAIGPLTNIAIAMSIDQDFTSKLKKFYVMGGNLTGIGNVASAAEFNFFVDPEAAKIVLDRTQMPIKLVPLETCFEHGSFSYAERNKMGNVDTEIAKFLNKADQKVINDAVNPRWVAFDQLCSAWLLDDLKVESEQTLAPVTEKFIGTVELNGSNTRGMMVRQKFGSGPCNIIAMTSMNHEAFRQYMNNIFKAEF